MNVIFDFNGTLFPDNPLHFASWNRFLAKFGVQVDWEGFLKYMCGPPNSEILRRFVSPDLTDAQVHAYEIEKERYYQQMVRNDPKLRAFTPGVEELLDALSVHGIRYAIATGSCIENVDFYFDTLGIGRWFTREQVFYSDGSFPGKPDPAIYRLTMKKLGFAPEDTIVFEDAVGGVCAAVGAGVRKVVAIDLSTPAERFHAIPEVIAVVHDFRDVLQYIL